MTTIPTPYEDLLAQVLEHGEHVADRTGTGTRKLFGAQLRYDLRKGFPLLTTKKVYTRGVFAELLWFLDGDTNEHALRDQNVNIWREWAGEDGDLGPIYGWNWRSWGKPYPQRKQPTPNPPVRTTYLGIADGSGKEGHPLGKVWEGMIARCYDPRSISYNLYGARGVSVCDEWLSFKQFASDAVNLPGYVEGRVNSNGERMELDKDQRGNSFIYSPEHCMWLTSGENNRQKSQKIYTVRRISDGQEISFDCITDFCREHGIQGTGNFTDLWTGRKNAKTRNGFQLVRVEDKIKGVDQIAELVEGIKNSPFSRRHLVTAWNPGELENMALPPCHALFQFNVGPDEDGEPAWLDCQLYQRSADLFLGVPFNIASYAALTEMVAAQTGLKARHFVWTGGDCHIYDNHLDQVAEQLSREPRPYPTLVLDTAPSIFDYELTDFHVLGYDPHPKIEAPVAV